jgi:CelD/BcsL family acetyltransferase involved in cellulose biosynthesis
MTTGRGENGEDKVQISVIRPSELGPEEIAAWHSMQSQSKTLANPFMCPEFAVAVDMFRTDARVAVLTDGSAIAGFFPFQRRRSFGVGFPIASGLTDCQGLIHAPGVEWDPRELLRRCRLSAWKFDHLAEGQRPFERYAFNVVPSPVIDLSGGFASYKEKLRERSPQFCKDLARKARKLEREAGELRFVVDSRDTAGLHALMSWKSNQYSRKGWVNVFDRSWFANLIDYLFGTHTDDFGGILSTLYAGETPVAAHFGLISGHVVAHWFPSYDMSVSRQSPGLIQHLWMAQEMAALGVHIIDMGAGTERYKQTLKSYDLIVTEGMVTRGSLFVAAIEAHRILKSAGSRNTNDISRHTGPRQTEVPIHHRGHAFESRPQDS